MIYNFDELLNRQATESYKWNRYPADVLPLYVADMDFPSPLPVLQALQERVEHGVFGYPGDYPGLRDVIVARMAALYDWKIDPQDIVFIPGVVTGFNMAAHALVGRGEGILIQPPVYMPFLDVAKNVDGILQQAELTLEPDGSYSIDWIAFEAAITPETRMFLLCNPHNPVGRVFTRVELERMADICLRHNLIICSDEIHCDLIFSGHRHIPIASLSEEVGQSTITLMAPSKTFNIAGLSCSFAIIQNPELRRKFNQGRLGLVPGVNLLGLTAAYAAYHDGQEWLDQLLQYLEGNRALLDQYVRDHLPGMKMSAPEGTYLAWLDCRALDLKQSPSEYFLEKARVAFSPGEAFGQGGEGFVRLNFGSPRPMLLEALERMRQALASGS